MNKAELYAQAFISEIRTGGGVKDALPRLRSLLARRGDEHLYAPVLRSAVHILENSGGTRIASRHELSEGTKRLILAFLKKRFDGVSESEAEFISDEKILGGVRILHEDFLFDGTLNSKIEKLQS